MSYTTAVPHVEASGNFLIPDGTFIAELVVFLLVLAAISRWVVPPVKASMEKRQEAIRQQLEDARLAQPGAGVDLDALSGELLAITGLLARELPLRRALADPSTAAVAKAALI